MTKIRLQRTRDGARLPMRAHHDDVGFDLASIGDWILKPGEFFDVPTGWAVEVPPHMWILILGRSSAIRKRRLLVHPGTIDPGFRGELFAGVTNMGTGNVMIRDGERIAQFIPQLVANPVHDWEFEFAEALSATARGTNGFGSSGS